MNWPCVAVCEGRSELVVLQVRIADAYSESKESHCIKARNSLPVVAERKGAFRLDLYLVLKKTSLNLLSLVDFLLLPSILRSCITYLCIGVFRNILFLGVKAPCLMYLMRDRERSRFVLVLHANYFAKNVFLGIYSAINFICELLNISG